MVVHLKHSLYGSWGFFHHFAEPHCNLLTRLVTYHSGYLDAVCSVSGCHLLSNVLTKLSTFKKYLSGDIYFKRLSTTRIILISLPQTEVYFYMEKCGHNSYFIDLLYQLYPNNLLV